MIRLPSETQIFLSYERNMFIYHILNSYFMTGPEGKIKWPSKKNLTRVPIYESKSQRAAIISKNQSTDTLWRQGFCKVTRLETFGRKQFIARSHVTLK